MASACQSFLSFSYVDFTVQHKPIGGLGGDVVTWGYYQISPLLDNQKVHPTDHWFKDELGRAYPDISARAAVKVLVIPSRWGEGVRLLQEAGFDAYGGDVSEEGLSWGQARGTRNLRHADLTDMKGAFSDAEFNVAICANLYDVGVDARAVAELSRVTRPGGNIYIIGTSRVDSSKFPNYGLAVAQELEVGGRKNSGNFRLIKDIPETPHLL